MSYEKSLSINDEQAETHLNLGMCYVKLNNYKKALEEFDIAYKYDDEALDAIRNKGLVYSRLQNYSEALTNFFIVNDKEPNNTENILDIAHCYYKLSKHETALEWLNKLLLIEPEHDLANKLLKNVKYLIKHGAPPNKEN